MKTVYIWRTKTNIHALLKILLVIAFVLVIPFQMQAQRSREITGTVKDGATGIPLPGVNVLVKGTNSGTTSDADGKFSLNMPEGIDVVVVSFIGYKSQEVPVNNLSAIDVSLESDITTLDEVVVVGYGTQKKSSLTSAVSDMKGEELNRRPISNVPQALQGLAAGVTVIDAGGTPGKSNATIRVRGITTLGQNDPLIMVDGIEQRLQDINPNDIESVTVLKDAASTAIYGSRAANGVVLVTTKRAQADKMTIRLDSYYAIQKIVDKPQHMNTEDYMRMLNVGYANVGEPDPRFAEEDITSTLKGSDRTKYPLPNDWYNVLFSPAPQQNHTLSVGGGNEQIKALLSINHFDQDGIIPNTNSTQNGMRLNTDYKISKRITISGDFNYRLKNYKSPLYENGYNRAINGIFAGGNFVVPRYPDGTYGVSPAEAENPLIHTDLLGTSDFNDNYGLINLKGEIELLKGLKFQTQYGGTFHQSKEKHFKNEYEIFDYWDKSRVVRSQGPNSLTEVRDDDQQVTLNNLLIYETSFGRHNFNTLLGYSQISFKGNSLTASRQNFYNNDIQSISQGSVNSRDNRGNDFEWGLRSYFGRLTYNYNERYFFEANARYDGSSRFTGKNKYGFFPSFSGAWRISEESFWDGLRDAVDEFKIRGSWGQTGNQAVGLYSYLETLVSRNYTFAGNAVQGLYQPTLANTDLTWETTTQSNIGIDGQLWEGKVGFTFDYYKKLTEGILLYLPIPAAIGLSAPPQNAGTVENKGWEFSISHRNTVNDLHYNFSFNISDVKNEILSLAGTGPYLTGSDTEQLTIRKEGLPIDAYMGYRVLGLFQSVDEVNNYPLNDPGTQPGDLKYEDVNKDGQINTEDLVMIGSAIPHLTFGWNINLQYRSFDLNVFFQGVGKAESTSFGAMREGGNWEGFTWEQQKDYWTPENTNAKFPRPEAYSQRNDPMSDFWMINTSYIKLKNLQIGYTLPATLSNDLHIQKCRMYVSGTNLFTISEAKDWGLDPEFPSSKLNYYPQTSLYTVGLNLSF